MANLEQNRATADMHEENVQRMRRESAKLGQLIETVYPELRRLAKSKLRNERRAHTLQPTALTNEVVLRLLKRELNGEDPQVVLWAGIIEMRRILLDYGRKWQVRRRYLEGQSQDALAPSVDEAVFLEILLDQLEEVDPRARKVVELRFFLGLSVKECADLLGLSMRTVGEDWEFAKGWLGMRWGQR